jgi:uncharacterized protein
MLRAMHPPALPNSRLIGRRIAIACLPGFAACADAALPEKADADCSAFPARSVERLVCRSPLLTSLDLEMKRVLALAATGGGTASSAIRQQQSAWLASRAACANSKTQEACVRDLYVERIAAIRSESKAARGADGKGTSLGPFAFRCEGVDAPLEISYVNVSPGLAWVRLKDQGYLLQQQRSGSGARYEGNGTLFWESGGEARWRATTGSPEVTCARIGKG